MRIAQGAGGWSAGRAAAQMGGWSAGRAAAQMGGWSAGRAAAQMGGWSAGRAAAQIGETVGSWLPPINSLGLGLKRAVWYLLSPISQSAGVVLLL